MLKFGSVNSWIHFPCQHLKMILVAFFGKFISFVGHKTTWKSYYSLTIFLTLFYMSWQIKSFSFSCSLTLLKMKNVKRNFSFHVNRVKLVKNHWSLKGLWDEKRGNNWMPSKSFRKLETMIKDPLKDASSCYEKNNLAS